MRYFSFYNCPDPEPDNETSTFSEKEIFDHYYPYWCFEMKKKYLTEGKNPPTEEALSFEECLEDWIVINWAWEVKNEVSI